MTRATREFTPREVARRIAVAHNRTVPPQEIARPGGFLVLDKTGRLIEVWTTDTFDAGPEVLLYPMHGARVTTAEVLAWLEALSGSARDASSLYGTNTRKPAAEEPVDAAV